MKKLKKDFKDSSNLKHEQFKEDLILFSIIIVPLLTLLLGLRKSPFDYTLSMIGYWHGYKISFIIWGIITAVLLSFVVINIYKRTKFKNEKAHRFLYL